MSILVSQVHWPGSSVSRDWRPDYGGIGQLLDLRSNSLLPKPIQGGTRREWKGRTLYSHNPFNPTSPTVFSLQVWRGVDSRSMVRFIKTRGNQILMGSLRTLTQWSPTIRRDEWECTSVGGSSWSWVERTEGWVRLLGTKDGCIYKLRSRALSLW